MGDMTKKLQIKMLSNSGELLSVVTCHAGQVSVFRAASASDIRPYQRALSGSSGGERFSVSLDGHEYVADEHTLIGFGESAPHRDTTVRDLLQHAGMLEGSVDGLLIAYGLSHAGDTLCSELTQDEERRVRLLAATATPSKVVILNEPFDPIASSWRERFAELLVSFARSSGGMVVVTSLSFRPEGWIDNDSVARIQVGQTAQRTVGFRARSATTTKLVEQLRQMIGDDSKVQQLLSQQPAESPQDSTHPTATIAATALAASSVSTDSLHDAVSTVEKTTTPLLPFLYQLKTLCVLGLSVLTIGGLYLWRESSMTNQLPLVASQNEQPASSQPNQSMPDSATGAPQSVEGGPPLPPAVGEPSNATEGVQPSAALHPAHIEPAPAPKLLVDEYAEPIRTSLLNTAQGILHIAPSDGDSPAVVSDPTSPQKPQAGNLFALLEGASAKDTSGGNRPPNAPYYDDSQSASDSVLEPESYNPSQEEIERQREETRQKFLEAIRAAAERRTQENEP